jgi:seryl-tRNA synthetase
MTDEERKKLNIDGKEVFVDELTEEQRSVVLAIQHLDAELPNLESKVTALRAARNAAFEKLKRSLDSGKERRSFFSRGKSD